ncbi:polyphosphate polymerase domain-containing protein [Phytohabitans rumicis]|uniref:VTC domain-containing protein n=1 Tax=Phytohabitans rumicis TaxID=1076125 RepID=A0A6V8LIB0_9ACTN|nr:polyphosphate polymerase domain-containing protein [Phytohabitans rumicis]GFJ93837.1 VTC domain-containing protein [Phytohabitans rumicis]
MTAVELDPLLWRFAPVGLVELIERAALQTRMDRKYVLPAREVVALLAAMPADARALEIGRTRAFGYDSVYFDTAALTSYRLTALRRRHRFKVRTRTYVDSAECWLEVKTEGGRGSTVKQRIPHPLDSRSTVDHGRGFIDELLSGCRGETLTPTLVTRFRRSTILLPEHAARVTIDTDLTWDAGLLHLSLPHLVVVETKTGSTPSPVDRALWARGHRPIRISKYGTGLAALRRDLPHAPWRRTLRRHFDPPLGHSPR